MKKKTEHSDSWHKQHHTEEHQTKIGACIANLLGLKANKQGQYNTSWGTKTNLGLYLSIKRVITEERINL